MTTGHLATEQRRLGRLHREDFRFGITVLDRAPHPGQRAACSVAGDDRVNRSVHLPQYFLTRRVFMVCGVQRILELSRQEISAVLGSHFAR